MHSPARHLSKAVLAVGGVLGFVPATSSWGFVPSSLRGVVVDDAPSPMRSDFPDPFVLREGDRYYAFATGGPGRNVQVATSRDLASWSFLPDALPELPSW